MDITGERVKSDLIQSLVEISSYHPDKYSTQLMVTTAVNKSRELFDILTTQQQEIERLKARIIEYDKTECKLLDEREGLKVNKLMLLRQTVDDTLEIERLKRDREKLMKCVYSTYRHDLPMIDTLCDKSNVPRFSLLRKELEGLLELPTAPEGE